LPFGGHRFLPRTALRRCSALPGRRLLHACSWIGEHDFCRYHYPLGFTPGLRSKSSSGSFEDVEVSFVQPPDPARRHFFGLEFPPFEKKALAIPWINAKRFT